MLRALVLSTLFAAAASAQTTWYVDVGGISPGSGTQLDPYTSIDFALQQATTLGGDTVLVAPGTYLENVSFPGRGVHVVGTGGAAVTTIDAGGSGSAVSFLSTDGTAMVLDGFTITGGTGTSSGGADQGGGVFALGCIARVRACILEGNTAFEGGGVYAENSDFNLQNSTVRNNTVLATGFGSFPTGAGLRFTGGTAKVRRSIIQSNTAGTGLMPGKGGGIYAAGPLSILRCSIADNRAELEGGGVFGSDQIGQCRIKGNTSQFGGGVYGSPQIWGTSFQGNVADSTGGTSHFGGAVYGAATLTDCYLESNVAFGEGGAVNGATLVRCTIMNNRAVGGGPGSGSVGHGGGVMNCTLTDCDLFDNLVIDGLDANGGGASESTLIGCTLAGNQALTVGGPTHSTEGGGAYFSTLNSCVVIGNTSDGFGGGIYGGTATSTEIVGNTANWGGGVASASINRCTVSANTATTGADGIHIESFANETVLDSIVWLNGTAEIIVEGGGSLGVTYSDVFGGWFGTGNINVDPLFWNPGTNDVHLQAGSPCIDAGNPASPLDPDGTRADMGAHPFDPSYSG